ncbi:MAG TPA: TrmJ/YjtD family RNA methyltransferase [Terriglobales bacterium]|nr:TrmJ/YjtD family RNA methyltransferase [Terriglobales bacterium]
MTSALGNHLCIVLVHTRNPLNIGAAARGMSNFGFSELRVVQPFELAFREARSAVGAADLLRKAKTYETVAEAVNDCGLVIGTSALGKRQVQQPVRSLEAGAKLIRKHLGAARVAILFGSEKTGLSNDDLSHCHWILHIPTRPEHLSMNLAQAVAVTLYEISRKAPAKEKFMRPQVATAAELERLTQALVEAASTSGFFTQETLAAREQKLRRLIRGLHLQPEDANILLGILRQILWKMQRGI